MASIPARLTLAAISLDDSKANILAFFWETFSEIAFSFVETSLGGSGDGTTIRRILPPQIVHWKVHPGNSILIKCGDVLSNPAPAWSFFK